MIPFQRSCKQVAALLVAREDRALPWAERLAVRLHMVICDACPRFEGQLRTLRHSMQMWRNYTESDPLEQNSQKN